MYSPRICYSPSNQLSCRHELVGVRKSVNCREIVLNDDQRLLDDVAVMPFSLISLARVYCNVG